MPRVVRQVSDKNWLDEFENHLRGEGTSSGKVWQEKLEELVASGVDMNEARGKAYKAVNDKRDEFWDLWASGTEVRAQEAMLRNNLLDSIVTVFQRADRILTGTSLNFNLTDDKDDPTPAYNNGKDIVFNASQISEISFDTILSLHGLNYHELAHLLFTPRIGSKLGKQIAEANSQALQTAFNFLEDCRAETYLVAKYPSTRHFLIATISDYLLKDPEGVVNNFPLIAGRRYYPLEVRQQSAQMYLNKYGKDKTQKVWAICSEYRTLVYPRDFDRGLELIKQFAELMEFPESRGHRHGDGEGGDLDTPNGCAGRGVMRNGRPESEKSQAQLSGGEKAEQFEDLLDGGGYSTTGEDNTNTGELTEEQKSFNGTDEELVERIEQTVERAKSDKELVERVVSTTRAIQKDSTAKSLLTRVPRSTIEPNSVDIQSARSFAQELERMRIDSDPHWEREKPSGKLNVRRAMRADVNDLNKLFDRWENGNDDYDIEAVVLADHSGSMGYNIGAVCRSGWIIKRAIEKIEGRVSLLSFNHISRTILSADEPAQPNSIPIVNSSGGTDPFTGLLEAERLFTASNKSTKLLFLLTDGYFNNEGNAPIARMNAMGVDTTVIFLNSYGIDHLTPEDLEECRHGANNFVAISKPLDLVKVAKTVVRNHLKGQSR